MWRKLRLVCVDTFFSVLLLVRVASAEGYIENPEGSCSLDKGTHIVVSCEMTDVFSISANGDSERYSNLRESYSSDKIFTVTSMGGLYARNEVTGEFECIGITSPWSVENSKDHSFVGTEGFYYFSNDFTEFQQAWSFSKGQVTVINRRCNAF